MFCVLVEIADGIACVRVAGELDGATAPQLQKAVLAALSDGASSVVLDCSELTFIDSAGLNVFLEAHCSTKAQHGSLTIARPSAMLLRLLQVTGLTEHFGIASPDA
jgi:anti-anti-sigma factor